MGRTQRAGRNQEKKAPPPKRAAGVQKATFDIAKKKEVGVSDLTLLSKVSDESINDNLKKRFENGIIYVSSFKHLRNLANDTDLYRPCGMLTRSFYTDRSSNKVAYLGKPFSGPRNLYRCCR